MVVFNTPVEIRTWFILVYNKIMKKKFIIPNIFDVDFFNWISCMVFVL